MQLIVAENNCSPLCKWRHTEERVSGSVWFKFVLLEPCLGRVGLSPLATFVALVLLSLSLDDWEFTFFSFSLLMAWESHELRTLVCLLYITDLSRLRLESQRGPVRILLSLRLW